MRLIKNQATILARLIEALRPEWEFHGIMAALAKLPPMDAFQATQQAVAAAADPDAKTPAAMSNPVYAQQWNNVSDPVYSTHVRRERNAHARTLDEARRALEQRDPEGSHRGYLAAVRTLHSIRPEGETQ